MTKLNGLAVIGLFTTPGAQKFKLVTAAARVKISVSLTGTPEPEAMGRVYRWVYVCDDVSVCVCVCDGVCVSVCAWHTGGEGGICLR